MVSKHPTSSSAWEEGQAKGEEETLKQVLCVRTEDGDEILRCPWGCWNKKPRKISHLDWVVVGWQHDVSHFAVIQDGTATVAGASELLVQQGL